MNLLVHKPPDSVEVDGVEYRLCTDFRDCITTILAFEDRELTEYEKQVVLLQNLYEEVPANADEALRYAIWFLNGGEPNDSETAKPRLYSFSKDANIILAAFRQTHGIDLQSIEHMHWWVFLALFMDLGQSTTFCNLVSLRKRVKTGKANKYEKEAAREMGEAFKLDEYEQLNLEELEALRVFEEMVSHAETTRKETDTG